VVILFAGSGVDVPLEVVMSKLVTTGATALFVCILCATPLSLRLSPEGNVSVSEDTASAVIGRPLTPMSVAGVNRRAHRRAYRQGYYGYGAYHPYRYGYGTYQPYSYYGAGYGSYRPSYGYAYQPNGYRSYGYQPWWTR
jgi:hypothetical protein